SPEKRKLLALSLARLGLKHPLSAGRDERPAGRGTERRAFDDPLDVPGSRGDPRGKMAFSLFFFSDDGSTSSPDKYHLLLECAKFADRCGFSAVWTPERHFQDFGGLYPNPSVLAA